MHFFRYNAAFVVVASSALLVSATNLTAGNDSSGFLFGHFGVTEEKSNPLEGKILSDSVNIQKNNLAVAPLAMAKTGIETEEEPEEEEAIINDSGMESLDNQIMAATSGVLKDPEMDGGVKIYEVQEGDTIGSIAQAHDVTVNTIKWANEIDDIDAIHPGDKIFILPVAGLTHVVKNGDTIESIAKEYEADEERIIAFNELPANGEVKAGDEIVIPDGVKDEPDPVINIAPERRTYTAFNDSGKKLDGKAGTGHSFPYGYCTWYVASRKYVPWGGNAGTWLYHAKAYGYKTGKAPKVGAIIVTNESWWGHVGIVEKVSGSSVTIREMNYKGWAKVSTRTISKNASQIKGYIY